jgi:hypothetical protein
MQRPAALAVIAFGFLLTFSATGPWARRFGPDDVGIDYVQGMVALAAGIAIAAVGVAALQGLLRARYAAALGIVLSAVALAMPLSLWFSLIGDADPALSDPSKRNFIIPGMEFEATTQLWSTVVAAVACLVSFTAMLFGHRAASDDDGPAGWSYAFTFALIALVAPLATWTSSSDWLNGGDLGFFSWSTLGVEHTSGLVAMGAALAAVLVSALAVTGRIQRTNAAWWAGAAGAFMVVAPFWFLAFTVGDPDPRYEGTLIDCVDGVCGYINAGPGLMLSVLAGVAYAASAAISLSESRPPDVPSAERAPARPGARVERASSGKREARFVGRWTP